ADDLDVRAARGCGHRATRASLIGVEITGDERLQCDGVPLELDDLNLQSTFFGEPSLRGHHHEARIALGFDDAVAPYLRRLGLRLRRRGPNEGDEAEADGGSDQ